MNERKSSLFAELKRRNVGKTLTLRSIPGSMEAMKTKSLFLCGCIALLSFMFAGTAAAADT